MKIKFTQDWHGITAGSVISMGEGVAQIHIEKGRAVRFAPGGRPKGSKNKPKNDNSTANKRTNKRPKTKAKDQPTEG